MLSSLRPPNIRVHQLLNLTHHTDHDSIALGSGGGCPNLDQTRRCRLTMPLLMQSRI